uniref:Uncharacterized protein n=1 Tax=Arundo donax TaxID=35708 RepID=A0A0A9EKJ7_ARUDO
MHQMKKCGGRLRICVRAQRRLLFLWFLTLKARIQIHFLLKRSLFSCFVSSNGSIIREIWTRHRLTLVMFC